MKRKNLLLVLAVFGFALMFKANFSEASGPTIINSGYLTTPTVWTKENSPYIVNSYVSMSSSGSLTIESGVIVKIGSKGSVYGSNNFYAKGTEDEKIVFTSWKDDSFGGDTNNDGDSTKPAPGDWDSIVFGSSTQSAVVENAVILYGGSSGTAGLITIASNDNTSIKNNEIKYGKFAGLLLRDSLPVVENNLISNNNTGVVGSNKSTNKIPVMRNNSIENNSTGAFTSGKIDARENWWGDKTGPLYDTKINDVEKNLGGKGNKVGDGVIFSPWLGDGLTKKREPIILVPGIGATVNLDLMVSGVLNDNWTLFDHTYDGIIQAFKKMGYEENKDLFICYYDWRKSNADSAKDFLKPLIAKANSINGTSKVNVVAH